MKQRDVHSSLCVVCGIPFFRTVYQGEYDKGAPGLVGTAGWDCRLITQKSLEDAGDRAGEKSRKGRLTTTSEKDSLRRNR
ncbi:MAG: hypothetical protein OXF02_06450 [Simkaniaceae bacterium]|nr:hypothetical protein [Simkaniaceae bacterium]